MAKARTQKETVAILQKTYPKFNKVAASMAAHPEKYGVCLTREAKEALGIKPKKANRKKSCQLTLRVTPEMNKLIRLIMENEGVTMQDLLEYSLNYYCYAFACIKSVTKEMDDG